MEKFLSKVARHLLQQHGNNLSGVTVLFPNRRSCTYFAEALKNAAGNTVWAPEINTLEDWLLAKSDLTLLEPLEQAFELYEVYRDGIGEDTADEFLPMAEVMLADFNEVDMQLANAKNFFNDLEKLQSLKVYEPGTDELSEYSLKYQKFWTDFRHLYSGIRKQLLAKQKGYLGMIYRELIERLPELPVGEDKLYFVGFASVNKCEERLMEYLVTEGRAEVIWDCDQYYTTDAFQEAGSFFRKYYKKFRVEEKWVSDHLLKDKKEVHMIGVAKNIGQTRVVADILSKLQLTPEEEKETAVVVLDQKLLQPLIGAIPESISALNVSMGLSLNHTPIAELIKIIFNLQDNIERFRQRGGSETRYYHRDVSDLLRHPYAAYLVPDTRAVNSFIERMKYYNRVVVREKELKEPFAGTQYEKLFWYTDDVKVLLARLLELIEALRVGFAADTEKDRSFDVEWLYQAYMVINNLNKVVHDSGRELSTASLRKVLLEHFRTRTVPFEGEPVKGLQLLGILETRAVDFKNVIVLSMNDGIFPTSKIQATYIPYEMRKAYLTTHHDKDALAAYTFYRLLQRAEKVHLLYNTESDELGGGEKSRFMLQLQHELNEKNPNAVVKEYVYSVDPPAAMAEEDIVVVKDEMVMQKLWANAEYGISPSAINTYINCTLQYYMRYVAGLREQEDIEESMEASTLGSAVHFVLETLYGEVTGRDLTLADVERWTADKGRIDALLKEFFKDRFDDETLRHGRNYLLYRVCKKLVQEFLKQEKRNLQLLDDTGGSMQVLMLEANMKQPLLINGRPVHIAGKVDRIERVGGVIHVADYKTGSATGSKINTEEMEGLTADPKFAKAMQLLNYAWLYWKSLPPESAKALQVRSGIYWLRDSAKGFDTLKLGSDDVLTEQALQQFEQTLEKLMTELFDESTAFRKTTFIERCANCEFARICRRD